MSSSEKTHNVEALSLRNDLTFSEKVQELKIVRYGKLILQDWRLYMLLAPIVIWFILFQYKPMGGLLIAFKDYRPNLGVMDSNFVGFHHFQTIISGIYASQFWTAFRNTLVISLYNLIFSFPLPILIAIMMAELGNLRYRKLVQTLTFLPYFLSEVVITGLVITLVYKGPVSTGIIAQLLMNLGLVAEGTNMIQEAQYFRPLFVITGIWQGTGYNSIIYFAAAMGVSPTLYEALKVDGGNKLQEIRYITLPGMAPTLITMIVLQMGNLLNIGYERIILLYNANTYQTADVISSFVFRMGLEGGNSAMGSAAGMFNSLVGFALVVGANYIARKISNSSLW